MILFYLKIDINLTDFAIWFYFVLKPKQLCDFQTPFPNYLIFLGKIQVQSLSTFTSPIKFKHIFAWTNQLQIGKC